MTGTDSLVLFVALGSKLQIYFIPNPKGDRTRLGTSEFCLVGSEMGFYDFLRDREKEIIGFRFAPFEHQPILDYALPLNYVYVDRVRSYMEIYLRGHRGGSVPGTAEQAFGDDAIWRSEAGVYALQLGIDFLAQGELDLLKGLAVVP